MRRLIEPIYNYWITWIQLLGTFDMATRIHWPSICISMSSVLFPMIRSLTVALINLIQSNYKYLIRNNNGIVYYGYLT